jgi:N-acetyl-anhydromuramyl-L-alanine amidase AmpD
MTIIDDLLPGDCYKSEPRTLAVDTVVVHFISALNWDKLAPEDHARLINAGIVLPQVEPDERKYHSVYCRALLVGAKLSYHYMIDRGGRVFRLVPEDRVAWHAGVSKMPIDGREWVNSFSIGVSLTASHPKDDPDVAVGRLSGYTDEQYNALSKLITDIRIRHPIRFLVGHDEIAPERKNDPGELFDWSRFRSTDFAPL